MNKKKTKLEHFIHSYLKLSLQINQLSPKKIQPFLVTRQKRRLDSNHQILNEARVFLLKKILTKATKNVQKIRAVDDPIDFYFLIDRFLKNEKFNMSKSIFYTF